jgi:ubiquinone/menaquinone biosynthesis C-methylase UbiE
MSFPETADIETSSDDYASRFNGEIGRWFLRVQEQATLQMLLPYPGATVLDVGGGHGQLMHGLVDNGYRVTVMGSSDECSARIRPYLDAGSADFRVGNILEMPYSDQSFDVVISYRLLAHVTRWQEFLAEMARVSRKAVILDYPEVCSINYIAPYLFHLKKRIERNTRRYMRFKERELLQEFRALGFRRADRFPQFFLPMVLHRALKQPSLSAAAERLIRLIGLTDAFGSPVILKVERDRP